VKKIIIHDPAFCYGSFGMHWEKWGQRRLLGE